MFWLYVTLGWLGIPALCFGVARLFLRRWPGKKPTAEMTPEWWQAIK
jgi:hypothetical protein